MPALPINLRARIRRLALRSGNQRANIDLKTLLV